MNVSDRSELGDPRMRSDDGGVLWSWMMGPWVFTIVVTMIYKDAELWIFP